MAKNSKKKYQRPERSGGDTAHAATAAALGSLPVVGSACSGLFRGIVKSPFEKRTKEWMEEVEKGLRELEEKGINLVDLQKDEKFIDVIIQASQIAISNSQKEKREALRNAIMNSALPDSPDESLQHIFISLIDEFTVWHLRILDLLDDPPRWAMKNNNHKYPNITSGGLRNILESAFSINVFPEKKDNRDFGSTIWKDLYSNGLINTEKLDTTMSMHDLMSTRTTAMGHQFLKFISQDADHESEPDKKD